MALKLFIRQIKPKMFATEMQEIQWKCYKLYASKRPYGFSSDDDPSYLSKRTILLADERSDLWYLKLKVGEKNLVLL